MPQQQVFSDRYELVRHVARGGMAQVYLARDLQLDRPVALKVLFPELSVDLSFVQRFRREAQAVARLSHPNIVSIFDWGQGEHTYFIVMEYVDGDTLSKIVREAALPADEAATIGMGVAAALEYAHSHGVIHRDVKPGNVLIDHTGQVKVADFGIARAVGAKEGLTQTGAVMGTATYFSPEQAQGFPVDARSDVYSLGVVLYEMVVGRPPFSGENPVSIAYKHVREDPIPPSQVQPNVPRGYEAVVIKALAKDPSARYQTAGELRDDLARFVQGEPVHAADLAPTVIGGAVGALAGATVVAPVGATRTMATGPAADAVTGAAPIRRPPRRRRNGGLVALLAALLVVLAVLLFFLGRQLGWWSTTRTATIPPAVVGQPVDRATGQLKQAGFGHVGTRQQADGQVLAGNVITTEPPPGTKAPVSRQIVLVVSSGPVQVTVPNVAGQTQADATTHLQAAGFTVNPSNQTSTSIPAGSVITTDPAPGTKAAQNSAVKLIVSSGQAQVTIPSVVGTNAASAGNKLGQLGLNVVTATEPSTTIKSGDVTRTNPPAGSSVAAGSDVTIYVSTGKPQAAVPNVVGQSQASAASVLKGAGFNPSFTSQAVSSPNQNGVVLSQNPAPGTSAGAGSTVTAVVGSYTAPTTTTPSTTVPSTTTPTT